MGRLFPPRSGKPDVRGPRQRLPLVPLLEVLPVHHQDLPQVRPGKDPEEGLLELLRVQAVEEGEDGVARGLAQAEVG